MDLEKVKGGDVHWVAYPVCQVRRPYHYKDVSSRGRHQQEVNAQALEPFEFGLCIRLAETLSLQSLGPRSRAAKNTKNLYLSPHWGRIPELATRSRATTVESYGENATYKLPHGPLGPRITADGLVYVPSGEIYTVSASVGVDTRTMHVRDVIVNICSGYNLIARKSLPLWCE